MKLTDILKLPDGFWSKLAAGSTESIQKWIELDALNGIMQDNTSNHQYKSESYKKYKANGMYRTTTGIGKGYGVRYNKKTGNLNAVPLYFKNKKGVGVRLKAYKGESATNKDISKVNMYLTGKMLRGIKRGASPEPNTLLMVFNTLEDGKKAYGNRDRNKYDILGLSNINREKVKERMLKEFKKNIGNISPKQIVIHIE